MKNVWVRVDGMFRKVATVQWQWDKTNSNKSCSLVSEGSVSSNKSKNIKNPIFRKLTFGIFLLMVLRYGKFGMSTSILLLLLLLLLSMLLLRNRVFFVGHLKILLSKNIRRAFSNINTTSLFLVINTVKHFFAFNMLFSFTFSHATTY